jgi:predicted DNA-binding protein (UPF0251 family)
VIPLPQDPATGWDIPTDLFTYDRPDARRPSTELEAIMQAKPGEDPQRSLEEAAELRDAVQAALLKLSAHDQRLIEGYDYEGLSYVELGERMGVQKSQAERLHKLALKRLRFAMLNEEVITERVGEGRTFESEVHRILLDLAPLANSVEEEHLFHLQWSDATLADPEFSLYTTEPDALHNMGHAACELLELNHTWSLDAMEKWVLKMAPRILVTRRFGVEAIYALALVAHADYVASTTKREQSRYLRKLVLLATLGAMYAAETIDNRKEGSE